MKSNVDKRFDKLWRYFEEENAYGYPEMKHRVKTSFSLSAI